MNAPNILIVDESTIFRNVIKHVLEPLKLSFSEAKEGQIAFELISSQKFDLIITGIELPIINGLELCKKIKNNSETKSIPVIIVSSFDSSPDIEKGFLAGASIYISKTEIQYELLNTVKSLLSQAFFHNRHSVLIVDDSPSIVSLLEDGLSKSGFKVLTAGNGEEAKIVLENFTIDLIISDIEMPKCNGFELCNFVRNESNYSGIPFMAMSSLNDKRVLLKIIQRGAVAFIVKPFNVEHLIIQIDRILSDQFKILIAEKNRLEHDKSMMIASISSLISALEARDAYTKGHSENVARLASGLAEYMGYEKKDIELILIGGKLHDIGKIGIRDDILLKKGQLTEEEYDIIKEHTIIGANILKPIESLSDIIPIVLYHHERIDGKGYPHQLKGNEIPDWACITAIADVYDALTSDRIYRKAFSKEDAIQKIKTMSGSQLHPEFLNQFLLWLESKKNA